MPPSSRDLPFPACLVRSWMRPRAPVPVGRADPTAIAPIRAVAGILALLALSVPASLPTPAAAQDHASTGARPAIPNTTNEGISVHLHRDERVVEVRVGPVELREGMPHLRTPVQIMEMPRDGWIRGYEWEMIGPDGEPLPGELLHHVNFVDPDERELFAPTSRRVLAAGRETTRAMLPPVLGIPFSRGTRYLVSAMFANSTGRDFPEAYLLVRIHYLEAMDRLIRPHDIYPFYLDVMGPVGVKDFPVPPGRTVRGWEGSPAVDARILGAGGHVHDHAVELRLVDLTAGRVLWSARPNASEGGRVHSVPQGHFWWRGGLELHRDHRYRVEVVYENPGDAPSPLGGMGVVAGVVMPAAEAEWPDLERTHPAYREDLTNHVTAPERLKGHDHGQDGRDHGPAEDDPDHAHPGGHR